MLARTNTRIRCVSYKEPRADFSLSKRRNLLRSAIFLERNSETAILRIDFGMTIKVSLTS